MGENGCKMHEVGKNLSEAEDQANWLFRPHMKDGIILNYNNLYVG